MLSRHFNGFGIDKFGMGKLGIGKNVFGSFAWPATGNLDIDGIGNGRFGTGGFCNGRCTIGRRRTGEFGVCGLDDILAGSAFGFAWLGIGDVGAGLADV